MGVVVVAAGSGTRLGAPLPKALVLLDGVPLVRHAVDRVRAAKGVRAVVVVGPASHREAMAAALAGLPAEPPVTVVDGGAERTDSVAAGLAALDDLAHDLGVVAVHDAARCLAPPSLLDAVVAGVIDPTRPADAAVPGLPVVDTVKEVDDEGRVVATPDRARLRAVQTPQAFAATALREAHARARETGQQATDDAALVESLGGAVRVVAGDPRALKVTTPDDLDRAALVLAEEAP